MVQLINPNPAHLNMYQLGGGDDKMGSISLHPFYATDSSCGLKTPLTMAKPHAILQVGRVDRIGSYMNLYWIAGATLWSEYALLLKQCLKCNMFTFSLSPERLVYLSHRYASCLYSNLIAQRPRLKCSWAMGSRTAPY